MPFVGRFLGPVLGPRKKMPKPVPASAKPEPLIERLKNTAKVRIKDQPVIQAIVGTQEMDDQLLLIILKQCLIYWTGNLRKVENK